MGVMIVFYIMLFTTIGIAFAPPVLVLIYATFNALVFAALIFLVHMDIKTRTWKIPLAVGFAQNGLFLLNTILPGLNSRSITTVNGVTYWQDGIPSKYVFAVLATKALLTVLVGVIAYHVSFVRVGSR